MFLDLSLKTKVFKFYIVSRLNRVVRHLNLNLSLRRIVLKDIFKMSSSRLMSQF